MIITLNGRQINSSHATLLDLVIAENLDPDTLIIEYNFEVAPQEKWAQITLQEEDHIELLSFVGGG